MEHLSKNPCGKWKRERDDERAARKDEHFYLPNKKDEVKKKKSKCGWWGRRAAKKRPESEVVQPPRKQSKQWQNYERKNKGVCGEANPFPTLDLTAKVRESDVKVNTYYFSASACGDLVGVWRA